MLTFALVLLLSPALGSAAPSEQPIPPTGPYTPQQLEQLTTDIALYPDPVLQPMLMAATFPEQVMDAALFLSSDTADAIEILNETWDETVNATANYPRVIAKMAENIDQTISLGDAFINQNKELLAAVQRLRLRAKENGNLESNDKQVVIKDQVASGETILRVEPAEPQIVYIPESTPVTVYEQPGVTSILTPLASLGVGMAAGYMMGDDDDDDLNVYGGGWYGGPGYWHRDDAFNSWAEHREEQWSNAYDFRRGTQESRQTALSNRQTSRQQQLSSSEQLRAQNTQQRRAQLEAQQGAYLQQRSANAGKMTPSQRAEAQTRLQGQRQAIQTGTRSSASMQARQQQLQQRPAYAAESTRRPSSLTTVQQQRLTSAREQSAGMAGSGIARQGRGAQQTGSFSRQPSSRPMQQAGRTSPAYSSLGSSAARDSSARGTMGLAGSPGAIRSTTRASSMSPSAFSGAKSSMAASSASARGSASRAHSMSGGARGGGVRGGGRR